MSYEVKFGAIKVHGAVFIWYWMNDVGMQVLLHKSLHFLKEPRVKGKKEKINQGYNQNVCKNQFLGTLLQGTNKMVIVKDCSRHSLITQEGNWYMGLPVEFANFPFLSTDESSRMNSELSQLPRFNQMLQNGLCVQPKNLLLAVTSNFTLFNSNKYFERNTAQ